MATLNRCCFIGRLGQKAEIRQMNNGKRVANFSLAVDQYYKKDGQKVSQTEWVRVVVFSEGLVGIIESYTDKGSLVYIEGQFQTRKWTDQSGVEKYTTEIVMQNFNSNFQMLGSKNKEEYQPSQEQITNHNENFDKAVDGAFDDESNIPF